MMISKSEILAVTKLKYKKFRESKREFIAEGKRLVEEGVKSSYICKKIFLTPDFVKKETKFIKLLESYSMNIISLNNKDFLKISSTKNPQGIAALFDIPKVEHGEIFDSLIVGLENISDPGNLGTILRSCDWFGIKSVILSKECAEIYNPKVLRASMGAIFNLNIISNVDLIDTISKYGDKNYNSYYADMKGLDYREIDYLEKTIIIFCNEAFGPSKELKQVCSGSITIPKKGNIESLNVAAAAAVILSQSS